VTAPNVEKIDTFLESLYRSEGAASVLKRLSIAAAHPVTAIAAFRHIMRHPVVYVTISRADRQNARWMFDRRRPWRFRGFISSYIELPPEIETYWRGTSKQNLRTRVSQARFAGLTVRSVDMAQIPAVIAAIGWRLDDVEGELLKMDLSSSRDPFEGAIFVALFDQAETAVGFCFGIQTGNVVKCVWSATTEKGAARWLCFSGFVEEASARGARFIIESPPWAFSGGNKIFAGHLGFSAARIRSA
jgi:hypothetical protein